MPNYSIVSNAKFNPFSYQEMLAPVLAATQAHQALEEAYDNLDTEAAVWNRRTEGSERAHALYTNFSKDLASAAEALAKYGLTPQSRRAMLNMKSRYASDITPIAEAWTKRQADIKSQQEALVKDPTHIFDRAASTVSLDEYMDNPNLDVLSQNYSKELLTQQVSQAAANLKQSLMQKGTLEKLGLPYQYERMLQYGASADEVFAAMSKDPRALPILTKLVDNVMEASGIRNWSSMNGDWANNTMYREAEAAAMRGLYSAIGTTKIDNFVDTYNMQNQLKIEEESRKRAEAEELEREKRIRMYLENTTNLYSKSEVDAENANISSAIKEFTDLGYLDENGVTELGRRAFKYGAGYGPFTDYRNLSKAQAAGWYNWAKNNGLEFGPRGNKSYVRDTKFNNWYKTTSDNIAKGELVTGVTNVTVQRVRVPESLSNHVADLITSAGAPIVAVGKLDKNGSLTKGATISAEDFKNKVTGKDGQKIKHIANNAAGNQQFVELANGERYFIPVSIWGNGIINPTQGNGELDLANAVLRTEEKARQKMSEELGYEVPASSSQMMSGYTAYARLASILDVNKGDNINLHGSVTEEQLYQ